MIKNDLIIDKNRSKKIKAIIIATILVDVLGLGIIIPLMPFFVARFSTSVLAVTMLGAVYALCSFISAPFLGALSDKIGRRPVLIVSLLSSAIGWFVFASANVLWILFLGKIIDGLAAGNFSTAQSALADIAKNDKERATNLGLAGALFGIGFIIGPAISGPLSLISPNFPFYFVSMLAFFNMLAAYFFFPETNKNLDKEKKISYHPLTPIRSAIKDKAIRPIYFVILLLSLAAASMQSTFSLYLSRVRGFNVHQVGMIITFFGVAIAFNQGLALKHFWLKNFSEAKLRLFSIPLYGLALLGIVLTNFWLFCLALFLMVMGQSISGVTVSNQAVTLAGEKRRGEVIGIMAALQSLAMISAPLIAGLAFSYKAQASFFIAGGFALLAFAMEIRASRKRINAG